MSEKTEINEINEKNKIDGYSYFFCIFHFFYEISNIKSKNNSIDIKFKKIDCPNEEKYKTYFINSKFFINNDITIEIQIDFYTERKNIKTFESKIDFEKNKSKFLYQLPYEGIDQKTYGIEQLKHNLNEIY